LGGGAGVAKRAGLKSAGKIRFSFPKMADYVRLLRNPVG